MRYVFSSSPARFFLAALWDLWKGPDGPIDTCTIITTAPNALMSQIHHRMPAILRPEAEAVWLDPQVPAADAVSLLQPHVDELLEAYPISKRVNFMGNDDPTCIESMTTAESPG